MSKYIPIGVLSRAPPLRRRRGRDQTTGALRRQSQYREANIRCGGCCAKLGRQQTVRCVVILLVYV